MTVLPSEEYFDHLSLREGFRNRVYKDSLGNLTVGTGHLLTSEECEMYKEGDLWEGDLEEQFRKDAMDAYEAALEQAHAIGLGHCKELVEALGHVCFQLGTGWNKIHKATWRLMMNHQFIEAALEAQDSRWYRQTPIRVKDFQLGLAKANLLL